MPKKKTTQEFINAAIKVHGDKYDYSLTEYINSNTKVTIICPLHGQFEQMAWLHLCGSGCRKCANRVRNAKNTKFKYEMLGELNKKFDTKYDFSKFVYDGYDIKSTVICPIHGEFQQSFHKLKYGHGCQLCGNERNKSEQSLLKLLREQFKSVEYQKKFDWLKYKKPMSLDFYLADYKVAIEYQGRQHFSRKTRFANDYNNTIQRDMVKMKLCKEHGINLYHITFEKQFIPSDFNSYRLYVNTNDLITDIKNNCS